MFIKKQIRKVVFVCLAAFLMMLNVELASAQDCYRAQQEPSRAIWTVFGVDPYRRYNSGTYYPNYFARNSRPSGCLPADATEVFNGSSTLLPDGLVDASENSPTPAAKNAQAAVGSGNESGQPKTDDAAPATSVIVGDTAESPSDVVIGEKKSAMADSANVSDPKLNDEIVQLKSQLQEAVDRARAAEDRARSAERNVRAAKTASDKELAAIKKRLTGAEKGLASKQLEAETNLRRAKDYQAKLSTQIKERTAETMKRASETREEIAELMKKADRTEKESEAVVAQAREKLAKVKESQVKEKVEKERRKKRVAEMEAALQKAMKNVAMKEAELEEQERIVLSAIKKADDADKKAKAAEQKAIAEKVAALRARQESTKREKAASDKMKAVQAAKKSRAEKAAAEKALAEKAAAEKATAKEGKMKNDRGESKKKRPRKKLTTIEKIKALQQEMDEQIEKSSKKIQNRFESQIKKQLDSGKKEDSTAVTKLKEKLETQLDANESRIRKTFGDRIDALRKEARARAKS